MKHYKMNEKLLKRGVTGADINEAKFSLVKAISRWDCDSEKIMSLARQYVIYLKMDPQFSYVNIPDEIAKAAKEFKHNMRLAALMLEQMQNLFPNTAVMYPTVGDAVRGLMRYGMMIRESMSKWAEKNGDCEINAFYERAKHVKNVLRLRPYNGPAAERLIARGLYGTTVT